MLPHIINGNGTISLMIDGTMKPIDTAHKNYETIKIALKEQRWDDVPALVNIVDEIEKAIESSTVEDGVVTIKDGEVFYNDRAIHNTLTDRIIDMAADGFDIGHMVKFLENLMKNPSYRAVHELYGFLEAGAIPITENGSFLAYKKITNDWKDIYTGTIDNSIGKTVTMERNMVNEDSSQTCSAGLHVCSYDYLSSFGSGGGDRVVICEINPKDVVSIPADYNNTKMRCCAYTVIGEVENYISENILSEQSVVETEDASNGELKGTVNHNITAKQVGKTVSALLDGGGIDIDLLVTILNELEVQNVEINGIIAKHDDKNNRAVGKRIATLIRNGDIDKITLMDSIDNRIEEEVEEDEDDESCDRCGGNIVDGECEDCGYYN